MLSLVILALVLLLGPGPGAVASPQQETPSTGVPAPDIIPKPDSGEAPEEAGDRGGALQLLVLGVVVLALAGGAVHLVRQARRAGPTRP